MILCFSLFHSLQTDRYGCRYRNREPGPDCMGSSHLSGATAAGHRPGRMSRWVPGNWEPVCTCTHKQGAYASPQVAKAQGSPWHAVNLRLPGHEPPHPTEVSSGESVVLLKEYSPWIASITARNVSVKKQPPAGIAWVLGGPGISPASQLCWGWIYSLCTGILLGSNKMQLHAWGGYNLDKNIKYLFRGIFPFMVSITLGH